MRKTWKRRLAKTLRDWAGRLDPQGRPGRKRKARAAAEQGELIREPHGWAEEPRA